MILTRTTPKRLNCCIHYQIWFNTGGCEASYGRALPYFYCDFRFYDIPLLRILMTETDQIFNKKLPTEIVENIFDQMDAKELTRCFTVCRAWHRFLIGTPWLWRDLDLKSPWRRHGPAPESIMHAIPTLLERAGSHLRTLQLDYHICYWFLDNVVDLLLEKQCRNVERFGKSLMFVRISEGVNVQIVSVRQFWYTLWFS